MGGKASRNKRRGKKKLVRGMLLPALASDKIRSTALDCVCADGGLSSLLLGGMNLEADN